MTQPYNSPYSSPAEPPKGKGLAIAALILGIIGILLGFTFCVSWLGALLGLVGIILGVVGLMAASKNAEPKKGLPIAGIITSVAALLIGVTMTVVGLMYAVEFAQWGITEGTNAEADVMASEARARGVDEETITAARERLTAVLEDGPESFEDMERYTEEVEEAKQAYRRALEGIPDSGVDEGAEDAPDETPEDTPDDSAGGD